MNWFWQLMSQIWWGVEVCIGVACLLGLAVIVAAAFLPRLPHGRDRNDDNLFVG